MAIDKSGTWWVGSEAADLDEYLRAFTAEGYPADRFVRAKCTCGHDQFRLEADPDEECAQRTCARCGISRLIADSEDHWSDAAPEPIVCPCRGRIFEVAVAFSHREDASVKWVTVGERCIECGVLGAAADWKIDYAPTDHLYDLV